MIGIALAVALQVPVAETVCQKLTRDFASNEVTYSVIYDANQKLLAADQAFAAATGNHSGVTRRLASNAITDEKFKADGDRIISLMAGNGCRLPDHVTSPRTYRADIAACLAAKGTDGEQTACGYIDRAVALSAPVRAPVIRQHRR